MNQTRIFVSTFAVAITFVIAYAAYLQARIWHVL